MKMGALDVTINYVEGGDGGWIDWVEEVELADPAGWYPVTVEMKERNKLPLPHAALPLSGHDPGAGGVQEAAEGGEIEK